MGLIYALGGSGRGAFTHQKCYSIEKVKSSTRCGLELSISNSAIHETRFGQCHAFA